MHESIDLGAIAARLREILGGHDQLVIEQAARRLRVNETAVRAAVSEQEPEPDLAVLIGVVREYGVDPTWLLTGNYDLDSHRTAIDDSAAPELTLMISRHLTTPHALAEVRPTAMPTTPMPLPEAAEQSPPPA